MPLQGSLREMSLANLIQVNCQEMRSARLTLANRGHSGEVYFSDGQVVDARLGTRVGAEAVYELLAWDEGSFVLDRDVAAPDKTITEDWRTLLLEGMMHMPERAVVDNKAESNMKEELLTQLRTIDGVTGAVIASSDGVVLDADIADGDGEREAAVAVFVGSAANQLGETLQLDSFAHGVVILRNKRILVLQQPDRYVGLILGESASPTIVASAANQIFKK